MKKISCLLAIIIVIIFANLAHSTAMITYTFDDGGINTLNAFNILNKYGQYGVVGPFIKSILDLPNSHLSYEQLRNFQKYGWEIASHSLSHSFLTKIPLRYQDAILSNWQPYGAYNIYYTKYNYTEMDYVLQNGDNFNLVSKGGNRLIPANSFDQLKINANNKLGSYFFDQSKNIVYLRTKDGDDPSNYIIQAPSAEREFEQSKREFEAQGLNVTTLLVPFSNWNSELRDLSKNFFSAVASTKASYINSIPPEDCHWLTRRWPSNEILFETLQSWVQDAIDKNYWLILGFHNIADGYFPKEKFDQLAKWIDDCENQGKIKVVTIREGITGPKNTVVPIPSSLILMLSGLTILRNRYYRKLRPNRYE